MAFLPSVFPTTVPNGLNRLLGHTSPEICFAATAVRVGISATEFQYQYPGTGNVMVIVTYQLLVLDTLSGL